LLTKETPKVVSISTRSDSPVGPKGKAPTSESALITEFVKKLDKLKLKQEFLKDKINDDNNIKEFICKTIKLLTPF